MRRGRRRRLCSSVQRTQAPDKSSASMPEASNTISRGPPGNAPTRRLERRRLGDRPAAVETHAAPGALVPHLKRHALSRTLRPMLSGDNGPRRRPLEYSALEDVLLLLMATLAVVVGLRRLRLPLILAFLLVGMIVGPHALGWVEATETTHTLAEFGVVFLLFTLGLEFSLPRLIAMRGEVFTLGGLQVAGTTAVAAAIGWALGLALPVAILLGGAVAMSSTAIVLAPAHGAGRAQPHARTARLRRAAVPGPRLRALPRPRRRPRGAAGTVLDAGDRARGRQGGRRPPRRARLGPLAAAPALPRDRREQRARAVHVRRALRRDRRRLGDARGRSLLRPRRLPRGDDAGGDGVPLPGRGRHPALPRHAPRTLLRDDRHAARRAGAHPQPAGRARAARGPAPHQGDDRDARGAALRRPVVQGAARGDRALAGRRVRLRADRAAARQPPDRAEFHAAAARRDHAQHADRAVPDRPQQAHRALPAEAERSGRERASNASRRRTSPSPGGST